MMLAGEPVHVWGQVVCRESLILPLNFAVGLKLLSKTSIKYSKKQSRILTLSNHRRNYYLDPRGRNLLKRNCK